MSQSIDPKSRRQLEADALERLHRYQTYNVLTLGGSPPMDPRCRHCHSLAVDVEGVRVARLGKHTGLDRNVWSSHFYTPNHGRDLVPDWLDDGPQRFDFVHTPDGRVYPDYLNTGPARHQIPEFRTVYLRRCSICGSRDPFDYARRHLYWFKENQAPIDVARLTADHAEFMRRQSEEQARIELEDARRQALAADYTGPAPECPKCGHKVGLFAKFCVKCGTKLPNGPVLQS